MAEENLEDYMDESIPNPLAKAVLLRDVSETDLPIFFEHQLDPEATRMAAFPSRGREAFMAHWTKILTQETIIKKTISFNGHVVGNIVYFEQEGKPQVGYWLGREYWGKGIATQALSKFLGLVPTRPLYAYVAKGNIASIRVLEKCGFRIIDDDEAIADEADNEAEELILKLSVGKNNHP